MLFKGQRYIHQPVRLWIPSQKDTTREVILIGFGQKIKDSFTLEWGPKKAELNCHGGGKDDNGSSSKDVRRGGSHAPRMNRTQENSSLKSLCNTVVSCAGPHRHKPWQMQRKSTPRASPEEDAHPGTTGVGVSGAGSHVFPFQFRLTAVALGAQQSSTHKAQSGGSALITTWFGAPPWDRKSSSHCSKKERLKSWRW